MSKEILIKARNEIKEIIKKYDVAGAVFLADGETNGEFAVLIDEPSWSKIKFEHTPEGQHVRIQLHMKTDKENSEKTINAFYNICGQIIHVMDGFAEITKVIESKVDVEVLESGVSPSH